MSEPLLGVLGEVLLPEPMPLLGVLGGVVLPLLGVLDGVALPLPVAPPAAPDPLPKCAFHSFSSICLLPSLSTSENFGALLLAPADAEPLLGALDEPDAPVELLPDAPVAPLPDALGGLSPLDAPVDDEPELCATATLARANSAAAVAVVMSFNIIGRSSFGDGCKDCG